jgi:hypothetical protein
MSGTGKSHQNQFFSDRMALLTVTLTWINGVPVVKAAAYRISFDNLVAHG